jgi:hypothetical protein
VLPELTEHGDLPPGVHVAQWTEIALRFGSGTRARMHALAALKRVHELASRTGSLRKLYVFGSFVSAIPEPRDIDVLLIMAASFKAEGCLPESRPLFSHLHAEARYGASVFWCREGELPKEFLRAWQLKRDGTLRGILEVP